jgi:F-type H+-transporting ATPase subunit gamma
VSNLKEIRARIASVASTEKITNAMKMVSAAKLKKSEKATTSFLPYKSKLNEALTNYLASLETEVNIPLAEQREPKRVALVAFASSSGLCGVYNSSVCKLFKQVYDEYVEHLGAENVTVFLVGKKINDYAKKFGFKVEKQYAPLAECMSYDLAM